jgi:hypothetical protein
MPGKDAFRLAAAEDGWTTETDWSPTVMTAVLGDPVAFGVTI